MGSYHPPAEAVEKRSKKLGLWFEDVNFSGWSGKKCSLCGNEVTKAVFEYSQKFYGKVLCRSCQRVEKRIDENSGSGAQPSRLHL